MFGLVFSQISFLSDLRISFLADYGRQCSSTCLELLFHHGCVSFYSPRRSADFTSSLPWIGTSPFLQRFWLLLLLMLVAAAATVVERAAAAHQAVAVVVVPSPVAVAVAAETTRGCLRFFSAERVAS